MVGARIVVGDVSIVDMVSLLVVVDLVSLEQQTLDQASRVEARIRGNIPVGDFGHHLGILRILWAFIGHSSGIPCV